MITSNQTASTVSYYCRSWATVNEVINSRCVARSENGCRSRRDDPRRGSTAPRRYFIRFVPAKPNKGASNEYFLRWLRIDRSTPSPRRRAATIALQCRRFYSTWLRFSSKTQVPNSKRH